MIVGVGKCAFGSYTMRHEHRYRQNCDCTRKLLPDRCNSRPGDQSSHGTGTPMTRTRSRLVLEGVPGTPGRALVPAVERSPPEPRGARLGPSGCDP